jgi:hypothetical protein
LFSVPPCEEGEKGEAEDEGTNSRNARGSFRAKPHAAAAGKKHGVLPSSLSPTLTPSFPSIQHVRIKRPIHRRPYYKQAHGGRTYTK